MKIKKEKRKKMCVDCFHNYNNCRIREAFKDDATKCPDYRIISPGEIAYLLQDEF